jgi:hypothetical protein
MTAVVVVPAKFVVIVVVVGVLGLLVVPMLLRRVMLVRLFAVVMFRMMPSMARETLSGTEARNRRYHGTGQHI